jgi:hypothetical protein
VKKGHFGLENLDKYDNSNLASGHTPVRNSLPTHDIVGEGLQIESRYAFKPDTTIGAKTLC